MLALAHLPALLLTTTVQCLPALIALVAWSEGGTKILRQYGPRMLWEIAALVVVGVGILLYGTVRLASSEGANFAVIVVTALSAVPLMTLFTHRVRLDSSPWRLTLAAGVGLVALQVGVLLGVAVLLVSGAPA